MKIEANSLDAVCLFVLYICLQDEEISDLELKGLLQDIPVLKDLYFQLYGEYSSLHIEEITFEVHNLLKPRDKFINSQTSEYEIKLFDNLISDQKMRDISVLVANSAASQDGLHKLEKNKIDYWIIRWTHKNEQRTL